MSISMNAAMRSGLVSAKAAKRDEGDCDNKGAIGVRKEINSKETQTKSRMSKGGQFNASQTPGRKAIDSFPAGQSKKFPRGAAMSGSSSKKTGNTRMKGPIPRMGGLYGGGGQKTQ